MSEDSVDFNVDRQESPVQVMVKASRCSVGDNAAMLFYTFVHTCMLQCT